MPKIKTHFPQVPVEIARKVAEAEANGHFTDRFQKPVKNGSNGTGLPEATTDEDEEC